MRASYLLGLVCLTGLPGLGCALCSTPYDYDYVTYGGRTPRTDMRHGRVGSTLSDPSILVAPTAVPIEALDESYSAVLEQSDDEVQTASAVTR